MELLIYLFVSSFIGLGLAGKAIEECTENGANIPTSIIVCIIAFMIGLCMRPILVGMSLYKHL